MQQVMTAASAHKSPVHPPPVAATVADVTRPPVTTVNQHDHVAAAAYLMKHAGTTTLLVVDAQADEPSASSLAIPACSEWLTSSTCAGRC
jgi:CBS domain-containing protein